MNPAKWIGINQFDKEQKGKERAGKKQLSSLLNVSGNTPSSATVHKIF